MVSTSCELPAATLPFTLDDIVDLSPTGSGRRWAAGDWDLLGCPMVVSLQICRTQFPSVSDPGMMLNLLDHLPLDTHRPRESGVRDPPPGRPWESIQEQVCRASRGA